MPDIEVDALCQLALLWEASGFDDYGEQKRAAQSVEINVRWVNTQTQRLDPDGNTVAVDAVVAVDREIAVHSIMWEGGYADLWAEDAGTGTGTGSEWSPAGDLMEVVSSHTAKDIKGRAVRRELGLKRFRTTMPGKT